MYPVLLRQAEELRKAGQVNLNTKDTDNVAVLVEPRQHVLLEAVVRNVVHFLTASGEKWNLTIFCGNQNRDWISEKLKGWSLRLVDIGLPNIDANLHNKLLRQTSFWEAFPEENVLVFQTDSCMLRRGIDKYMMYDFIGAWVCNPLAHTPLQTPGIYGGFNGGFSFRHRSAMLECLLKVSIVDINKYRAMFDRPPLSVTGGRLAEDIYFYHACSFLNKSLPDEDTANKFSTEAVFNRDSIGIHAAFDKDFFPVGRLREMVEASELKKFA